tara:strand:+ start:7231 stop:8766 length:1536 start_codon:yes stop_codon:yes gene_type:complete
MKLTQLFLCSASLALPLTLHAATQKSNDRWFDVEIIIFSQLDDKSQSKENFPDTSELPNYPRAEDLLRHYINPDIRSLKQLLPSCDSPQYGKSLVEQNAKLPAIFNQKSLDELVKTADFNDENQATSVNNSQLNAANIIAEPTTKNAKDTLATPTLVANDTGESSSFSDHPLTTMALPELTAAEREKIQQLVLAAENEFQVLKFNYTRITEPKILCKIDEAFFTGYQAEHPSFDYDDFTVDKMPLLIDGKEDIDNDKTHLLSKDSLQLDDIIQDLRYSKNFRPLLHMGWRQVARPEKESVPVKVYADDNFSADHKKQLAYYNKQKNLYIAQAKETSNEQDPISIATIENQASNHQEEQIQAAKKIRIQEVIKQLSQVNENTEALLTELEVQELSLKAASQNPLVSVPPVAPVQPWYIDGFFNIHLQHYLFITADFNILDKNLSELATARLTENAPDVLPTKGKTSKPIQAKSIRFKQDRRVISGEVHYFDHPYMGMIVQIRPYTKPEPEAN